MSDEVSGLDYENALATVDDLREKVEVMLKACKAAEEVFRKRVPLGQEKYAREIELLQCAIMLAER